MKQKFSISNTVAKSLPKSLLNLTPKDVEKFRNIGEVILSLIGVGGVVSLSMIAPNALKLVNTASWAHKTYQSLASKKFEQKKRITKTLYYLKRHKYIKIIPKGEDFILKIKDRGREKVREMSLRKLKLPKNLSWNGKWWIVLADIPVELHSAINAFRKKIKELGMLTLQKSVWIYPFNPSDEIAFLSKYYNIDKYISIIEVCSLEPDDETMLLRHFKKIGLIKN